MTDVRLGLGWGAFLIAAACFGWDYKFGFDATKYYTAAAVVVYSILNGALTLWIWLKEAGTVYEGTSPSGEKVSASVISICSVGSLSTNPMTYTSWDRSTLQPQQRRMYQFTT